MLSYSFFNCLNQSNKPSTGAHGAGLTFARVVSHPTAAPNANAGGEESPGHAGRPAT
ncbi:hypothetical protein GCM10027422_41610 [Hymenobacter arcticus]